MMNFLSSKDHLLKSLPIALFYFCFSGVLSHSKTREMSIAFKNVSPAFLAYINHATISLDEYFKRICLVLIGISCWPVTSAMTLLGMNSTPPSLFSSHGR